MSVGRNSFGLAPYYEWKNVEASQLGIYLTTIQCGVAGTSTAVIAGTIQNPTTTTYAMLQTTDGSSWSIISGGPTTPIYDIAYGNGVFVAAGSGGLIYSAQETAIGTWTARTNPVGTTDIYNATFLSETGQFTLMTQSGRLQYSTNGTTWTQSPITTNTVLRVPADASPKNAGIAYLNGMHVLYTGEYSTTGSVRGLSYKDISVNSSSTDNPATWTAYPEKMSDGTWYVNTSQTTVSGHPFARIGWGSYSAYTAPVLRTNFLQGYDETPIGSIVADSATTVADYLLIGSVSEFGRSLLYYFDGYYQVIGAAQQKTSGSVISYGAGHVLFSERDLINPRKELIANTVRSSSSLIKVKFKYVTKFRFKEKEYIIFGRNAATQSTGPENRVNVIIGKRAFRVIRTTTDYRF